MLKSVLITGCSDGTIGNALALEFARREWRVYASARKTSSMGNLASLPNVILLPLDITNRNMVIEARDRIAKETEGKLDVLFHNAGVRHCMMAIDADPTAGDYIDAHDEQMFETNVTAVMAATRIFAPQLIAAGGTIAFTGSVSGVIPQPGTSAYNATKAALDMYSRVLRMEMKPLGVKVVYVQTGGVQTSMIAQRVEIPESSLYRAIDTKINDGWVKAERAAQDVTEYAGYIVERVSRETPPELVWQGTGAWKVWLVELLNQQWLYPWVFSLRHGLDKPLL